jgi:energy-coupling factor transporter ATP-binding protein EcfA2
MPGRARTARAGFLRPLRRAGAVQGARGRDRRRDGRFQADGLRAGEGAVLPGATRSRGRRDGPRHLGHRAAPPPARGARDPRMVLLSRGGGGTAPHLPPRAQQGFTVFFTGLSGSGKSTIANALMVKLMEMGGRPVTLLDGDVVRKHLSSELGFSKEHRDINIRRIGYVASEITKNGGIALCAPIAPYAATRRAVREMIEALAPSSRCMWRPAGGMRAARPQGALQAGARRQDQGVHRHLGPLRGARGARVARRHRERRRRSLRPAGAAEAGKHGAAGRLATGRVSHRRCFPLQACEGRISYSSRRTPFLMRWSGRRSRARARQIDMQQAVLHRGFPSPPPRPPARSCAGTAARRCRGAGRHVPRHRRTGARDHELLVLDRDRESASENPATARVMRKDRPRSVRCCRAG